MSNEKLCPCKDRPASQCPGEWEPGCDLGANEKYVRVHRDPTFWDSFVDGLGLGFIWRKLVALFSSKDLDA